MVAESGTPGKRRPLVHWKRLRSTGMIVHGSIAGRKACAAPASQPAQETAFDSRKARCYHSVADASARSVQRERLAVPPVPLTVDRPASRQSW